jgi:hypothetical protein
VRRIRLSGKENEYDYQNDQWSTGLDFDRPTQKACPAVGLSRPMDKPVAKCGLCERERREPNVGRLYVETGV